MTRTASQPPVVPQETDDRALHWLLALKAFGFCKSEDEADGDALVGELTTFWKGMLTGSAVRQQDRRHAKWEGVRATLAQRL